jgi:hypothetical protein
MKLTKSQKYHWAGLNLLFALQLLWGAFTTFIAKTGHVNYYIVSIILICIVNITIIRDIR